jgi:5'-methylthioadenosine phosphorylase
MSGVRHQGRHGGTRPGTRRDRGPLASTAVPERAEIGVFGGSGFYSFLDEVETVEVETPYGKPSAPLTVGAWEASPSPSCRGTDSITNFPPAQIPYRANVWAMRELGVRRIIGPNASGSLKAEIGLGAFVVTDQFVDRTSGRADTFYEGPDTTHVSAADPYCPELRRLLVETARERGIPVRDGGTVVVIQGPRFSTRAESRWFQQMGWDTINMTQYPEGHLARELELCYANISMVTDHDVGVAGPDPVSHEQVVTVFTENNEKLRDLLFAVIPRIGPQPDDVCARALEGARI